MLPIDGTKIDHHFIELVLATSENTKEVGWFIGDETDGIKDLISIPFYKNVTEGAIFDEAEWNDPAVRMSKIHWRENHEITWLERHMKITQGFMCVGRSAGLMILGEPTHQRDDLTEDERRYPDYNHIKGYIIPPGCGIIIKKGTWHDFPVSVGPDLTVMTINSKEIVEALVSMKEPAPMDFGDCYKIRNSDRYPNIKLQFPDPRQFVKSLGF